MVDIPETLPEEIVQKLTDPPKDKKDDAYRTDFIARAEAAHEQVVGKRPVISMPRAVFYVLHPC